EVRRIVVRRPPRARALREDLERVGADLLRAIDRGVNAAGGREMRADLHRYAASQASRSAASSSTARRATRGSGAKGTAFTLPFRSYDQLPATTPSTRKVCVTSPSAATTDLRSSSGSTRARSACAKSVLSHFGRKRTGAGVSAGGSGARGRSRSSRPLSL